jgi:hypothetical protein
LPHHPGNQKICPKSNAIFVINLVTWSKTVQNPHPSNNMRAKQKGAGLSEAEYCCWCIKVLFSINILSWRTPESTWVGRLSQEGIKNPSLLFRSLPSLLLWMMFRTWFGRLSLILVKFLPPMLPSQVCEKVKGS